MKNKFKRGIFAILLIIIFALLTSCSGPDEHIWLKSPGWSRAAFLGNTTLNDPVPMALDAEQNTYFVLLESGETSAEKHFTVLARDPNAFPLWQHSLENIFLHRPDSPQLIWDGEKLHLFWIDEEHLYSLSLDSGGNILAAPQILSGNIATASYSLAQDNDSGAYMLWIAGARKTPGVYALSSLEADRDIRLVDAEGIRIQLRYDHDDALHATWVRYPVGYGSTEIFYAAYPAGADWNKISPTAVRELAVSPSNSLSGPMMGIDATGVYVFWTVVVRSGLESGAVQTEYTYFPLGQPEDAIRPSVIAAPSIYALQYEYLSNSPLDVGERVSMHGSNIPRTVDLVEILPNPVQADELAIVFRSPTQHLWRKVKEQVNMAYFYEGEPSSYQPLSFTTTLSTSPNILNSPDRHLYVTWLEKVETDWYAVYFASTAPAIEEALSHSTSRELGRVAAQMIFGILVGILLAPIAAGVWMVAPLGALFITSPLRKIGSNRTRDIFTWISLALAVFAFWLGKLATLPGMMDYVPFSAWIPEISHFWAEILRWAVPLIFMLFSLFVAWYHTYRVGNKTSLYFLLIYIGVDSLLTAAVYAVLIYGTI